MLLIVCLSILIGVVIWKILDDKSPLDAVPGPSRKPIIGNALLFFNLKPQQMFLLLRKFSKQFGDRYVLKMFNRRILHVFTPNDIEVVLGHSKNITKSMPYTFLQPWLGTGLLLSTGLKWRQRRKILTPTFHFNILKNFSSVMAEKSRDLVEKLKETAGDDVDIIPVISDFTLFTICETAMGTQLDKDKSAKTVEYKSAIKNIGHLILQRTTSIWLHNDYIYNLSALKKTFETQLNIVHQFADSVIEERKQQIEENSKYFAAALEGEEIGVKKRLAMLDLLIVAQANKEIDLEGIKEEVNTFMFEGHDTTAVAITFALMLLADHDDIQNKIFEECQAIFGDSHRIPHMSDLTQMKYLDTVIKETLRLYPSVPFIARTITEDFKLGDFQVNKGSEVAIHIYDLHRREDLYPDPEKFNPDRFLSSETRHPYAYVPFSAGPRNCIGQRFAILEMKYVLSEILRVFKLVPTVKGARPQLISDLVLRCTDPIYIKFLPRKI